MCGHFTVVTCDCNEHTCANITKIINLLATWYDEVVIPGFVFNFIAMFIIINVPLNLPTYVVTDRHIWNH